MITNLSRTVPKPRLLLRLLQKAAQTHCLSSHRRESLTSISTFSYKPDRVKKAMQGVSFGGSADVAQLQSTMLAIEQACSSVSWCKMQVDPAAGEETISALSRSPHPYQTCQFIIENSQVAIARSQAAAAIRDAALREWECLTADHQRNLISFCLQYCMRHADSPDDYVLTKVSSVAAQLFKRGWLDFTAAQKDAIFHEVHQAVIGTHGADVQYNGIKFLESLVHEFEYPNLDAMGLSLEFHEACWTSLEHDYLKKFYCWAQEAVRSVANKIVESSSEVSETKVCSAALCFMVQILNREVLSKEAGNTINISSAGPRLASTSPTRSECIFIQSGPSWRDVLIESGHTEWIVNFYGTLRQKYVCEGYSLDSFIPAASRTLIEHLCTLTGSIVPSDNLAVKKRHLLQLLSGFSHWIDPHDAVTQEIKFGTCYSEVLDGCAALLSIARVTTPLEFDQLLKSVRPYGTFTLLSGLMSEVLKDLMVEDFNEEAWSWVARDFLLDTWTALLSHGGHNFNPTEEAAISFSVIVEAELKAASVSVFYSDHFKDYTLASVSDMDERLGSYALIARAATEFSIPLLARFFSERVSRLHQFGGTHDPKVVSEEIYSLLLLAGHVLSDEGEGETPLVPTAIETHFLDVVEPEKHPVVILSRSILTFAEQSVNPNFRSLFSPRLMEALVWFLGRWSSTYLMQNAVNKDNQCNAQRQLQGQCAPSGEAVLSFFGERSQGKHALDIIVRVLLTSLTFYQGEKDLQALSCRMLLPALVRGKHLCTHLISLDSWRDLANALANNQSLFSIDAALQDAETTDMCSRFLNVLAAHHYKEVNAGSIRLGGEVADITDSNGKREEGILC